MNSKTPFLAILLVLCAGCTHTLANYEPSPVPASEPAAETLTQLLREQEYSGTPLVDVEVHKSHFKVSYVRTRFSMFFFIPTGVTSIESVDYVYFNNIADIEFYTGHGFKVCLNDAAHKTIYCYHSHRKDKAKAFMDVVSHIMNDSRA